MGVLDKIKNALFEVEYVEVEEPPKKEKKVKKKEPKEVNKPIAKKIVLPGKKEEKVEELEEEELRDEDFEIRPKDETIKEVKHDDFKFMDDKDFQVEEDVQEEPKLISADLLEEKEEVVEEVLEEKNEFKDDYYSTDYYSSNNNTRKSRPYGMDSSYNVPVHEYGTYERKEEKTYFKPSPIISPIYGILDKNYKKEDVREKKDIRLTTYTRSNVSVDDIRNKAYGEEKEEVVEEVDTKFEVEEDDDNLLVDLSDRDGKPEVKELTMGDALEYFQDLGLEYNVDYVDVSKEKKAAPKVEEKEEVVEKLIVKEDVKEKIEEIPEVVEEVKKEETVDDNDNLFDLIDSMYQEKD